MESDKGTINWRKHVNLMNQMDKGIWTNLRPKVCKRFKFFQIFFFQKFAMCNTAEKRAVSKT